MRKHAENEGPLRSLALASVLALVTSCVDHGEGISVGINCSNSIGSNRNTTVCDVVEAVQDVTGRETCGEEMDFQTQRKQNTT
ncbi:hypothetical protein RRG08_018999 [Elysia crispata]|uniref:Uncharacterized protein n=1 Tax=Elysia crispata TaxID=231223 RepID=A0AAE1A4Y4_9GAST|nr:hypothetical protein RRG08_018999 [Elysia crispata]